MILIIIFALSIITFLVYSCSKGFNKKNSIMGIVDDIPTIIEKLMKSNKDDAFLIIKVKGTENFIQCPGDIDGSASAVSDIVKLFIARFLSVTKDTALEFEVNT